MPFYEYECSRCGHYTEAMQKISDPPLRKCPACGKQSLRKLVSAPVFRLKGSGWYETDFKTDKDQKRNLAGSEPAEKSDTKTEAKAEAKADAKVETKSEAKSKPESKPESKPKSTAKRPAARAAKSKTVKGKRR